MQILLLTPTKIQILCLMPKIFNIVQVNLNLSFMMYLIITKKQILYSYNIQKTYITFFIYIK